MQHGRAHSKRLKNRKDRASACGGQSAGGGASGVLLCAGVLLFVAAHCGKLLRPGVSRWSFFSWQCFPCRALTGNGFLRVNDVLRLSERLRWRWNFS